MKILYDNNTPNATLTVSSENPNFRFSDAFGDTILARRGRTIGTSSITIVFAFPAAITVTDFAIVGHNIESNATVALQANTSNSWGSPPLNRSQTINTDFILDSFASVSYQYWRLTMTDATTVDGYFSISKLFLGTSYTVPDANAGIDMPHITEPLISKSRGGQIFGRASTRLKSHNITLSGLTQAQVTSYETFADAVNLNTPFIFIPFESSTSTIPPYYANANSHGSKRLSEDNGVYYEIQGINFEECK